MSETVSATTHAAYGSCSCGFGLYRVILPCHGCVVEVKTWAGSIFCDQCGATYWLRNLGPLPAGEEDDAVRNG